MYRVIVADDERHVVDWMEDLLTLHFPDLEIRKANSGTEVFEKVSFWKVDFAVLDIKMPGLNGIVTARRLLGEYPNCKILLLTGYDEFDLIYQVSNEKNIRYILKTEADREIIKKISEILSEIEQEERVRQTMDSANRKNCLIRHFEQKGMLYDIIFKSESFSSMKEKISFYDSVLTLDPKSRIGLTLIQFSNRDTAHQMITSNLLLLLYQNLEETLGTLFRFALLDMDEECVLLLTQPARPLEKASERYSENEISVTLLRSELDRGFEKLAMGTEIKILFFIYNRQILWREIAQEYYYLRQYCRISSMEPNLALIFGTVVGDDVLKQNSRSHEAIQWQVTQYIQKLSLALVQSRQKDFYALLDKINGLRLQIGELSISAQAQLCAQLSLMFLDHINLRHLHNVLERKISLLPLYCSMQTQDWAALLDYAKRLADEIIALSDENLHISSTDTIQTICDYIQNHLADDLSVTHLAEVFNYNQSYISRLFKQVRGETLSQYIKNARLNCAKTLLKSTDLTIQKIAAQVGFDTVQYFSMVFRKEVGTTPTVFRASVQTNTIIKHDVS